jgi:hypothetical protein
MNEHLYMYIYIYIYVYMCLCTLCTCVVVHIYIYVCVCVCALSCSHVYLTEKQESAGLLAGGCDLFVPTDDSFTMAKRVTVAADRGIRTNFMNLQSLGRCFS